MYTVDVLDDVISETRAILADIRTDQTGLPTPCAEFTVGGLADHLTHWVAVFAGMACGTTYDSDHDDSSTSPVEKFTLAGTKLVSGLRDGGIDRTVSFNDRSLPAESLLFISLIEVVGHGLDLTTATRQKVPFTSAQLALTLERARASLRPETRGDNFGPEVEVSKDAPLPDRVLAFLGREPQTTVIPRGGEQTT